jgi:hypothetical protein
VVNLSIESIESLVNLIIPRSLRLVAISMVVVNMNLTDLNT